MSESHYFETSHVTTLPVANGDAMIHPDHLSQEEPATLTVNESTRINDVKQNFLHSAIYHYFRWLQEENKAAGAAIEKSNIEPIPYSMQGFQDIVVEELKEAPRSRRVYQGILDEMLQSFPYLANFPPNNTDPMVEILNHPIIGQSIISSLQHEIKLLEQENGNLLERLKQSDLIPEESRKRKSDDFDDDSDSLKRSRTTGRNDVKQLSLQSNIGKREDVPDEIKELVISMRKQATKEKRNTNKKLDRLKRQVEVLVAEKGQIEKEKDEADRRRKDVESKKGKAGPLLKARPRTEAEIAEEIRKRNGSTGPLTDEEQAQVVARKMELAMAGIPTDSITAPTWDERFNELLHFHKGYNHCRVPVRTPGLGRWVAQMRADYRTIMTNPDRQVYKINSSDAWSLNADRIERLTSLGFEFQLMESVPWELRFQELVEFKNIHHHCKVPRGYKENIKLSEWVHMQRKNFRKKLPSIMGERFEKLNKLGFLWDIKKANPTFESRMEQLRDFRREHGHLDVPPPPLLPQSQERHQANGNKCAHDGENEHIMDCDIEGDMVTGNEGNTTYEEPEGTPIADEQFTDPEVLSFRRWVQRQRDEYNTCYLLGKKCSLDKVRVKKLEELGFSFDRVRKARGPYNPTGHSGRRADPDKYKERIERLRIVKEICGDCNKAREIFPEDQILLDWMKAQRKQWKNWQEGRKSSLTTERRRQLEELGFAWQPRSHYAPYGSKASEKRTAKAEAEAAAASMAQFSQDYNDYSGQL